MAVFPPQGADFSLPTNLNELASTLSIPPKLLKRLTDPVEKFTHYERHQIPKRRPSSAPSFREVWECRSDEVATVHKTLNRRLSLFIKNRHESPHEIAHGYVPGRSTVTNAQVHAGANQLLRADVRDFFESIQLSKIIECFKSLGVPKQASSLLGELCTLNGHLPLGLHASPLIANLICRSLDVKLAHLAKEYEAKVTRYADDIAFSGIVVPKLEQIQTLLQEMGFELSIAKCRKTKRGQAHFVTGLSISDNKPHVPKTLKRKLRQELYYSRKFGLQGHCSRQANSHIQATVNRIDGTIRYVNAVEPTLAMRMRAQWNTVLKVNESYPAYQTRFNTHPHTSLFIDETEIPTKEGNFLAIGLALTTEVELLQSKLEEVRRKHLIDPSATGNKETLKTRGLHFVDDSEDLRTAVFKILETLPFRGYIAYIQLKNPKDYASTFEKAILALLQHRFMYCDGSEVALVFEINSKLNQSNITRLVGKEFQRLVDNNERRPTDLPKTRFGTKQQDPCLAIADYLLAAFRNYAVLGSPNDKANGVKQKPGELAHKRFERLRDRIRTIISLPNGRRFGRRNPFTPWPGGSPSKA